MSDQKKSSALDGLDRLDEFTQREIISQAQQGIDQVNSQTARMIEVGKEKECSAQIRLEIEGAGKITVQQRATIIDKWHRRYGLYEHGQGGSR